MKVLTSLLLGAAMASHAQTYDFTPLDQFLSQTAPSIPGGFEVVIVQNGQQIYGKQFGAWPRNKQANIASATKWLSGVLIMSLVDDGILSLDDRASRYLPYLTGDKMPITIRQLMSHTAGFPGEFPLADPCLGDSSGTLDACAQALARVPLQAPPGTAFIYAGAGMQIAGRVAEVAAGKDWQTLFRERIAAPLGLTATDFEYEGPTRNPRISGGGRSNVTDYMKFLSMIRERGVFEGGRVLSTRAIDAMLRDQTGGVPIVESPFQSTAPTNRYGIGNWLESPDGLYRSWQNSSIGAGGWTPLIDASRNLQVVLGMQSILRPFQPYYPQFKRILERIIPTATLTPVGVTNAASFEAGPVVPGEFLALFGSALGPSQPSTLPAGTRVTFDGDPGVVSYAGANQVMVQAPFSIAGKPVVEVQVTYNGAATPSVSLPVAPAWPALFALTATGQGQAAVLNEDGSINSPANPAPRGTVLQFFGTGACQGDLPASVTMGGRSATVRFCGPAPGLPAGVFQMNALVPVEATAGNLSAVMESGGHASLPVITVSVQ